MGDVATPHRTLPIEVLITEPLTTANRGEIARWLEDQGIAVGVPADVTEDTLLILDADSCIGPNLIAYADRLAYDGARVQAVDQAHYELWYEPVNGRTEP